MKSARKLIPALVMLLVSAIVMSSASFAWFSMNKEVTATNMKVTVKADNTYLLINTDGNAGTGDESATATSTEANVFPSMVKTATNASDVKFQYAVAATSGAPDKNSDPYVEIADENLNKYVLKNTFYVTVKTNTAAAKNLKIKTATFNGDNAISALVVTSTAKDSMVSKASPEGTVLAVDVTDSACVQVDVYVYYNGEDASVYTDNIGALNNGTLELVFAVD